MSYDFAKGFQGGVNAAESRSLEIVKNLLSAMDDIVSTTSCQIAQSIAIGKDGGEAVIEARAFIREIEERRGE